MSGQQCKPCGERGERVAAAWASVATGDLYCEFCWMEASYLVRAKGGVRLGVKGSAVAEAGEKKQSLRGVYPEQTTADSSAEPAVSLSNPPQNDRRRAQDDNAAQEGNMPKGYSRRKIEIDEAVFRGMHARGMNDGLIASKLGCSIGTVLNFRKRMGLAAHGRGKASRPGRASQEWNSEGLGGSEGKGRRGEIVLRAKAESNGHGALVPVRIELLDAFWAALGPEEKARVMNRAVEARE